MAHEKTVEVGRRTFLKYLAMSAAGAELGGMLFPAPGNAQQDLNKIPFGPKDEQTFITVCRGGCNWGCCLHVHVRDGIAYKITPAPYKDSRYTGMCLRGLSHIQRTYSRNRIKYPMRRIGERGGGHWERITWSEAIEEIGRKLCHYRDEYGGQSIVMDAQAGNLAMVNGCGTLMNRLGNCIGATFSGDVYDRGSCHGMYRVMGCGDYQSGNEPSALLDSKMIVIWGTNPVYSGPHVWRFIQEAHSNGCRTVCLDPSRSATAQKCDEWVQVVPGSDTMIVLAMCNYILEHGLMDTEFVLNNSNAPFLVRRDTGEMYIRSVPEGRKPSEADYFVYDSMSKRICPYEEASSVALEGSYEIDGVQLDTVFTLLKKHLSQYTLADASEISGVPEPVLRNLAETWSKIGPVTINLMYSLDHYQNGHLFFQAAGVLQTLTGNIGRPGSGFSGVFITDTPFNWRRAAIPSKSLPTNTIPSFHLYNVWRDQEYKGKPYPLKALITACSNSMGNYAEQGRWFSDIFPNLEFWVVLEIEMTDCARHADIVLPASYWLELYDVRNVYMRYVYEAERAIKPLHESKPDSEIIALIGNAMGYGEDFPLDRKEEDWAAILMDSEALRKRGITRESLHEKHMQPFMGGDEIQDEAIVRGGKYSPIPTPHGRLMLYWENPAPRVDFGQKITPEMLRKERFPYFRPPAEAWKDNPLHKKYPLVFIQEHARFRTHTQFFEVPMLRELDPEPLAKMGRECAESRGIRDGELVEVFNDRGHAVARAVIDDGMGPGIISIPKGWQRHQFISGSYQELTSSELEPMAVGGTWFDVLVDVRPWSGDK